VAAQQPAEQEEDAKEVLIDVAICNPSSSLFWSSIPYVLFKNYVYKHVHRLGVIEFDGDLRQVASIIDLRLRRSYLIRGFKA